MTWKRTWMKRTNTMIMRKYIMKIKRSKTRTGHRRKTTMEMASVTVVMEASIVVVVVDWFVDVSHRYIAWVQFFLETFIQLIGVGILTSQVAIKDQHRFIPEWELDLSDPLDV